MGKYLLEVLIIVISILSAFWLEQYRDDMKDKKDVKEALNALHREVRENRERIHYNYVFFKEMAVAFDLLVRSNEGNIELSKQEADSLKDEGFSRIKFKLENCDQSEVCKYQLDIIFDTIPDFPFRNNVWNSINSSQLASKIPFEILAVADNFYNSWTHDKLYELVSNFNSTFISETGNYDVIPPIGMFNRLRALHEVTLSNYDTYMPEFEILINDLK